MGKWFSTIRGLVIDHVSSFVDTNLGQIHMVNISFDLVNIDSVACIGVRDGANIVSNTSSK